MTNWHLEFDRACDLGCGQTECCPATEHAVVTCLGACHAPFVAGFLEAMNRERARQGARRPLYAAVNHVQRRRVLVTVQ